MTQEEINMKVANDMWNELASKKYNPICKIIYSMHGRAVFAIDAICKAKDKNKGFKKALWTLALIGMVVVNIPLDLVCLYSRVRIYKNACKMGFIGSYQDWQAYMCYVFGVGY